MDLSLLMVIKEHKKIVKDSYDELNFSGRCKGQISKHN